MSVSLCDIPPLWKPAKTGDFRVFGSKTFDVSRIRKVACLGYHLAQITFITVESIVVVCGAEGTDRMRYTYPGT